MKSGAGTVPVSSEPEADGEAGAQLCPVQCAPMRGVGLQRLHEVPPTPGNEQQVPGQQHAVMMTKARVCREAF